MPGPGPQAAPEGPGRGPERNTEASYQYVNNFSHVRPSMTHERNDS